MAISGLPLGGVVLGIAGLIFLRFFTVPDSKAARSSVVWRELVAH